MSYDYQQAIHAMARTAAENAHRLYCRDIHELVYLFFRPSTAESFGKIQAEHTGLGWNRVTPEPIPRDRTIDGLQRWIHNQLQRLPLLPPLPAKQLAGLPGDPLADLSPADPAFTMPIPAPTLKNGVA